MAATRRRGGATDMGKVPMPRAKERVVGSVFKGGGLTSGGQVRKNGPLQKASDGSALTAGLKDGTALKAGNQSNITALSGGTNKGGAGRKGEVMKGGNASNTR